MARRALPAALLAVVALATYAASVPGGFVWDDRPLIVENRLIKEPASLAALLTSGFWETGDRYDRFRSFFRPVVSLTYAADHAVWGLNPIGYRLTNLVLHFLCCFLVYRIARGEGLGAAAALAGGLLFAVHPVHVESVAWISGRTDLLCGVLLLGAFLAHRRAEASARPGSWRAGSLGFFLAALLSKEMAATLPALIAADRYLTVRSGSRRIRTALTGAIPYLAVLAVYLVARRAALGSEAEPLYRLSLESHAATALFVLGRYTTLLLLPFGLDAHHPFEPLRSIASPLAVLGLAVVGVAAFAAVRAAGRWPRSCFWIVWIYCSLAPVLAFGTFGDVLLADRFLYIPSVGLSLLLARGVASTLRWSVPFGRVALASASAIVAVFGLLAGARSLVWKDDLALFRNMAETSPRSAMVRCNLGLAYYHRGDYARAREEFQAAIDIVPSYALAHNNLAAGFERDGDLVAALRSYEAALRYAPRQLETQVNVANLMTRLGREREGLARLRDLVEHHPRYVPALYAYAEALYRDGRSEESIGILIRASRIEPRYPHAHYLLGKIHLETGRPREAVAAMRRFLDLWTEGGVWAEAARRVIAGERPAEASTSRRPASP